MNSYNYNTHPDPANALAEESRKRRTYDPKAEYTKKFSAEDIASAAVQTEGMIKQ